MVVIVSCSKIIVEEKQLNKTAKEKRDKKPFMVKDKLLKD